MSVNTLKFVTAKCVRFPSPSSFPLLVAAAALAFCNPPELLADAPDALAEYVHSPDTSFTWNEVERREVEGVTAIHIDCVSQTWRSNVWHHQILVVRPPKIAHPDIALLLITGDGKVDREFELLKMLALRAGAVTACLNRVPNQPLYDGRKEDALIAYTFEQYLKSADPTWPLLFPMVKSAVRAMDAIQNFTQKEFDQKVVRFVVTGASKRGWTTWLTGATDPRVTAIAPMVIDMLNLKVQTEWATKMYGRQSDQVADYSGYGFPERMNEPRMVQLREWVDPYSYRARYKMPKLLLLGTNDPYWVVDSLRHYWNALPEPKLIFQTPNAAHDLAGGAEAKPVLAAFFQMIADRQPLPKMTWQFKTNSPGLVTVQVKLNRPAKAFRLWTADWANRDFRKAEWSNTPLTSSSDHSVVARIVTPDSGFRAYLVEAELATPDGETYKLSTEARVVPDGLLSTNPPAAK